jgi:hypothetical protein
MGIAFKIEVAKYFESLGQRANNKLVLNWSPNISFDMS